MVSEQMLADEGEVTVVIHRQRLQHAVVGVFRGVGIGDVAADGGQHLHALGKHLVEGLP